MLRGLPFTVLNSCDTYGNKGCGYDTGTGRFLSVTDPKEQISSYTYDANGNVLTVSDGNGTITRTYDALNRVKTCTDYKGNTISYGYDELGNRISISWFVVVFICTAIRLI